MSEKPVLWLGSSLADVRAFPKEARERVGYALYRVQQGVDPSDWKPMRTVGPGVRELRIQIGRAFRVLYVAKFAAAVYVLHAFEKKSRKTNPLDVSVAKRRLAALSRSSREETP